jgi:hypothetical protein
MRSLRVWFRDDPEEARRAAVLKFGPVEARPTEAGHDRAGQQPRPRRGDA